MPGDADLELGRLIDREAREAERLTEADRTAGALGGGDTFAVISAFDAASLLGLGGTPGLPGPPGGGGAATLDRRPPAPGLGGTPGLPGPPGGGGAATLDRRPPGGPGFAFAANVADLPVRIAAAFGRPGKPGGAGAPGAGRCDIGDPRGGARLCERGFGGILSRAWGKCRTFCFCNESK